jgi:hypothetical protein
VSRRTAISVLSAVAILVAAFAATRADGGGGPPPLTPAIGPAAPELSITALGVGSARVGPAKRTDRAIGRAVAAAHARAIPRAFAAARAEGTRQARAAGVRLGSVLQLAPMPAQAYGYWQTEPNGGTFGIGRWCGVVRVRRSGGFARRERCQRPHLDSATLSVTFALVR